ncbi:MAG: BON domain-containing protein, partial [Chloroflexota bacterium]
SHYGRRLARAAVGTGKDLGNRLYGLFVQVPRRFAQEKVDDETLVARVRSQLGRVASRPGDIFVVARDGYVALTGLVPSGEMQALLTAAANTPGVQSVENQLVADAEQASPNGGQKDRRAA